MSSTCRCTPGTTLKKSRAGILRPPPATNQPNIVALAADLQAVNDFKKRVEELMRVEARVMRCEANLGRLTGNIADAQSAANIAKLKAAQVLKQTPLSERHVGLPCVALPGGA